MRDLHNVLSFVAYRNNDPVTLAKISDDVTGEYNQVAIAEYCLTALPDLFVREDLVGLKATVAKADYKIIDALEFGLHSVDDLRNILGEMVSLARYEEPDPSEAEAALNFISKLTKELVDDNEEWKDHETDFSLVSILLEPIGSGE